MNIISTIHTKYQGETMFCFICVATVFGYILGVNKVIECIITKHSHETRLKIEKMVNKYTQTNLNELAELLTLNNLITSSPKNPKNVVYSSVQGCSCSIDDVTDKTNDGANDGANDDGANDGTNDGASDGTNETSTILNSTHVDNDDKQEKKEDEEKQILQENAVMSPSSVLSIISTSEEDYELVKKNENNNHSKPKNNTKYFEWLNFF